MNYVSTETKLFVKVKHIFWLIYDDFATNMKHNIIF